MTEQTRRLSVRLSVDNAREARGEIARVGEAGDQAMARIVTGAQRASSALNLFGIGLSTLSAGALAAFVNRAVNAIGGLGEIADQLGVSTDALQAFRFAAIETGVKNEELEKGFAILTRRIAEAASGERVAEEAFRRLGVSFRDAGGNARATEGVLADIADKIAAIESPAERARIATDVFGDRLGQRLIPLLAVGREGLERLTAEALRYGVVADAELIASSDEAADRIAKLGDAFGRLAQRVAGEAAPALTAAARTIERLAFGAPISEQLREAEAERGRLAGLRAQAQGGVLTSTARGGRTVRTPVAEIDRAIAELDQQIETLTQRNAQFEERARQIVEGRTRAGANEAELRRQRAAEDITALRETFDARLRIEREYQDRLDRIRRGADAGAVSPDERTRLETEALRLRNEALQRLAGTTRQVAAAETGRLDTLRRQLEVATLLSERERFIAQQTAGLSGAQRAEAERLAATLFATQEARRAEGQALGEIARLYEQTRTPVEAYTAALERLGQLRPALEQQLGQERANEVIGRRAEALLVELQSTGQQARQTEDIARQLGLTFESAFERAVSSGENFRNVLASIVNDISRLALRQFVTQPLLQAAGAGFNALFPGLSNIGNPLLGLFGGGATAATNVGGVPFSAVPNANGNAFGSAGIIPFARGGVVQNRTLFGFAGGVGEMGEAGPEAILPLRRNRDGRLGVEMQGGGGGAVNITINSPDADGFRRTRSQIAGLAADVLRRGQRLR